nr:hypothetical protein [Herbaspirillum sp. ASV7]
MWLTAMWGFLGLAAGTGLTWVSMYGSQEKWGSVLIVTTSLLGLATLFCFVMMLLGIVRKRSHGGPKMELLVGQEGPYVETRSHNIYNLSKTVLIGVKNSGSTLLTNCKLEFEATDKDSAKQQTWHRDGPFSLNIGEERLISLAMYGEPVPPHPQGTDRIQLSALPSSYLWRAPALPLAGGVVKVIAFSSETPPCELYCKLWVENEKLKWERL